LHFRNLLIGQASENVAPVGQSRRRSVTRRFLLLGFVLLSYDLDHYLLVILELLAQDVLERLSLPAIDVSDIANDGLHRLILPQRKEMPNTGDKRF
jgi:hypothetical protein